MSEDDGTQERGSVMRTKAVKRIPIAAAKRIAVEFGQQQVIVLTWDGATTHVVTYGTTLAACEQAAQGGNRVKRALGWPESLCNDVPAHVRRKQGSLP